MLFWTAVCVCVREYQSAGRSRTRTLDSMRYARVCRLVKQRVLPSLQMSSKVRLAASKTLLDEDAGDGGVEGSATGPWESTPERAACRLTAAMLLL